jgi:hypothetical protein
VKRKEIAASRWNAPPEMARIATERTRDIVRLWCADAPWNPVSFGILAESCYMQGINDSIDAIQQRGLEVVPRGVLNPIGEAFGG